MDRPTRGGNILDSVLTSQVSMIENLLVNDNFFNYDLRLRPLNHNNTHKLMVLIVGIENARAL